MRLAPHAVEPLAPGKLSVATKSVTVKMLAKKYKRVKLTKLSVHRSRRTLPLSGAIQQKSSATGTLRLKTRHRTPPRWVARLLLRCVASVPPHKQSRSAAELNCAPCPGQSLVAVNAVLA